MKYFTMLKMNLLNPEKYFNLSKRLKIVFHDSWEFTINLKIHVPKKYSYKFALAFMRANL
jgi:hypothetical protein